MGNSTPGRARAAVAQIVAVCCASAAVATILLAAGRTPGVTGPMGDGPRDDLYGAKFISPTEGWVVGAFGTIFRTRDGGQSWEAQGSGTTRQLFDVDFVDAANGWLVGRSGLILHTTDGGATWLAQDSGVDRHLFAVDFVDRRLGYVVGDWGAILITRDGGATWESHALPEDLILNDVVMTDRSTGWIAGERGTILATEDGGGSWVKRDSGVTKTLFGIDFADRQRGWAVGIDALILHTTDGGITWEVQHGSTEARPLEQVGFSQAHENPNLYAVAVAGEHGVVVGDLGAIFLSADRGRSWTRQPAGHTWFRGLSLVPGTHGAIVGGGGQRAMIVDGRVHLPSEVSGAAEAIR